MNNIYEVLKHLDIKYTETLHQPVFTAEESQAQWTELQGAHCKNLFFRDKKGTQHYLVILDCGKEMPIKQLNKALRTGRLSFASDERLFKYLALKPGAVSPFGLINDTENHVIVFIDSDLKNAEAISFHPNINTATLTISYNDFVKFMDWTGNHFEYVDLKEIETIEL